MSTPQQYATRPIHVLVVDHDEQARERTVRRLLSEGCDVSVASWAEGLADRAARLGPDMVLVDVLMPGLRGEEVSRLFALGRATGSHAVVIHTRILRGALRLAIDMKQVRGVISAGHDEAAFLQAFRAIAAQLPQSSPPLALAPMSGMHRIGEPDASDADADDEDEDETTTVMWRAS